MQGADSFASTKFPRISPFGERSTNLDSLIIFIKKSQSNKHFLANKALEREF
jgi:hypothetical protein